MLTIKHHVSCIHSTQIFVRLQSWISLRNGHSHSTDNTELPVNWMCSGFRRKLEYMDSSEPKCNGSTFRNWTWRLKSWRICLMKMEGGRSQNRLIRPWNTEEGTVLTLDKVVERYTLHESLNKCIRKELRWKTNHTVKSIFARIDDILLLNTSFEMKVSLSWGISQCTFNTNYFT